ncbi:hypothetical protein WM24_15980 [Burkholderia ubonensis]|nr:hypothetical protein WM24_15980 [Burkholderia ubonensis]
MRYSRIRMRLWLTLQWLPDVLALALLLLPLILALDCPGLWPLWLLPALTAVAASLGMLRLLRWVGPGEDNVGVELTPDDAPQLFAELERIRVMLDAPAIHSLRLCEEFNAGIRQDRSSTGRKRNVLWIGMPLLECLSPEACSTVLAHEYAHITQRHGRFARRIYFTRMHWRHVRQRLEGDRSVCAGALRLFMTWYVPKLLAVSERFAWQCEYQADMEAARLCGSEAVATALASIELQSGLFARTFLARLAERGEVGGQDIPAYARLAQEVIISQPIDEAEAWAMVHSALCRLACKGDTHPSLAERVAALGVSLTAQSHAIEWRPTKPSAACSWFGDRHVLLAKAMDQVFKAKIRQNFEWAMEERRVSRQRYHSLLAKRRIRQLTPEQACELIKLTRHAVNDVAALELCRDELRTRSGAAALLACHADILFSVGRRVEAERGWRDASLLQGGHQLHCLRQLSACAMREQDWTAASNYREQADKLERGMLRTGTVNYQPHNLSAQEYEALVAQVRPLSAKAKACWLLMDATERSFLLVILPADTALQRLVSRLRDEVPPLRRDCEFLASRIGPTIRLDIRMIIVAPRHPLLEHCVPSRLISG